MVGKRKHWSWAQRTFSFSDIAEPKTGSGGKNTSEEPATRYGGISSLWAWKALERLCNITHFMHINSNAKSPPASAPISSTALGDGKQLGEKG